ncbi:putative ribosome-binding factor A, mitochondrial [Scyliorhinus canicula]|uniref:putative ribosome-binding factor A, mitochondrial n=1 Tax=Scyliorhinus canicula TaxID=7830 RepID=UPI0018F31BB2|nr:putative ribosome-binding factor A, mitochondrial [Scyliorhinus canicula]
MAAVGVLSALRRCAARADCCKLQGLLVSGSQCRNVQTTCCLFAKKSLLKKFLSKTKKKFWYESPTLRSQLFYKPSGYENVLKPQRKMQKEDSIRLRTLNNILYKAITELVNSNEVSSEVYDQKVEISKVLLAVDYSACRAYWVASGSVEKDNHIQQVLEKYSPRVRHVLITQQVMGSVPPVVFVKDQQQTAIAEVERLLEIADYGSEEETAYAGQVRNPKHFGQVPQDSTWKPTSRETITASPDLPPSPEGDLFGIDHDLLNRQILEYKKKSNEKLLETNSCMLSEQHQQQLAHLQKLKRKKKKSKYKPDDITPDAYFSEKYYMDSADTLSDKD